MVIQQYKNSNKVNITHLTHNSEWYITNTCALNTTITTSKDLDWWVVKHVVHMKRESIYFFYILVMPCTGKIFLIWNEVIEWACQINLCGIILYSYSNALIVSFDSNFMNSKKYSLKFHFQKFSAWFPHWYLWFLPTVASFYFILK